MKTVIEHLEEELTQWQFELDHEQKMYEGLAGHPTQKMYNPVKTEKIVKQYERAIKILKEIKD